MPSTYKPTFTDFRAGENAPLPREFESLDLTENPNGLLIVNKSGSMALNFLNLETEVVFDDTVSPTVVRFRDAKLLALFGFIPPENEFAPEEDRKSGRCLMLVRGDYAGPFSMLRTAVIPDRAVSQLSYAA